MSEPRPLRLLIAGGGTGGHVFPALAVAEEVVRRDEAAQVRFVGTARGLEARLVPEHGWDLDLIDVIRLKGGGLAGWVHGLLRLPRALLQSRGVVKAFDPDVVMGVGGYASGPVVLWAALTGRPTLVLEQNAVAGFTNRILGRFVDRVVPSFDAAARFFPERKVRLHGNPVRRSIREALEEVAAARKVGADDDGDARPLRLFVFGGSQGARTLNRVLPEVAARLEAPFEVLHQTGEADRESVAAAYSEHGREADVRAFVDDMAEAYRWCDLAVCRAGATSVCELAVAGVPSVLIPFPYAADDHQAANAAALVEAGAARMVRESELDAERLAADLDALARDRGGLAAMAAAALDVARPEAAERIVDEVHALARGRG